MTTAFPARATLAAPAAPDNATAQNWFSALWDAITGLVGSSGNLNDARSQLGVDGPTLTTSLGANALTINLKTATGNDPSAAVPLPVGFRNATISNGARSVANAVAATSLTVPAGTTLGTTNGADSWVYVYAINAGGVVELGVSLSYFGVDFVGSSSAITGGSNSGTIYSNTARASVPMHLLGVLRSNQGTAGQWAAALLETQYPEAGQLQSDVSRAGVAIGSGDALTITLTPNVASHAAVFGSVLAVRAPGANTLTNPTFAPNGLTAKTIVKGNNSPLRVGDISGAGHWLQLVYDLALDVYVLLNPASDVTPKWVNTRNVIINGNMTADQRNNGGTGTVPVTATGVYVGPDRWYLGAATSAVSVQTTQGYLTGDSTWRCNVQGTSGNTGAFIGQRIEKVNCFHLAGRVCTLSARLSHSALTSVNWAVYYTTLDDTWGSRTLVASGTFTGVTSTDTLFSTTVSIPSAAYKGLNVELSVASVGASLFWTVGDIQFEEGAFPLANVVFDHTDKVTNLARCYRYYESGILRNNTGANTSYAGLSAPFKSVKRVAPTCTYSDGTTLNKISNSGASMATIGGGISATVDTVWLDVIPASALANWWQSSWTASAEL